MKIEVSSNLIKNIKDYWKKEHPFEEINKDKCYKFIFNILYSDEIIQDNFAGIEWIVIPQKFQGVFVVSLNEVIYFSQHLGINKMPRSRNTYISQNFKSAKDFSEEKNARISISIHPLDKDEIFNITANSIRTHLNELIHQGLEINDSIKKLFTYKSFGFKNIEEFIKERNQNRNKNSGNDSTFLDYDSKNKIITVYGKLDGANGKDTQNVCATISKLTKNEKYLLNFFDVTKNTKNFSKAIGEIKKYGFKIINVLKFENEIKLLLQKKKITKKQENDLLKRNQNIFRSNIIKKYINIANFNFHKCFACDYFIESNLIASHIYRYTDIISDFNQGNITAKEAAHLIVSGENGFLLCPTQDKEFEKGIIVFDITKKKFIVNSKNITSKQFEFLNNKIISNDFSKMESTEEFKNNINKHYIRVGYNLT